MRRGKICIAVGIFIIGTALMCNMNKSEVYEKKLCFNSPEEIIEVLNSNPITSFRDKYTKDVIINDTYLECLSKRKRLTDYNPYISKYNLHINEENENEEYTNANINNYKNNIKNLKGYTESNDIRAYNLEGIELDLYGYEYNRSFDVIFIKEGEGWVIDYMAQRSDQKVEKKESDPNQIYD